MTSNYGITINGIGVPLRIKIKNAFLKTISEKNNIQNWVDIEHEYYNALNPNNSKYGEVDVNGLNQNFERIKDELKEYLRRIYSTLQKSESNILNPNIIEKMLWWAEKISITLFLNFNYTTLCKEYEQNLKIKKLRFSDILKTETIQIHGDLDDKDNPIIFGYGDEIDDNYKHIEKFNDNRYLEYVKSIKYLNTDNYRRLLNFIDSHEYEIFIMGHSCGISDRTLLNTLFEHKNCAEIRVFYHKRDDRTDNYSDMVRNISRNFVNKQLMRKTVVNKKYCKPLSN
jgi:hypothetical protein